MKKRNLSCVGSISYSEIGSISGDSDITNHLYERDGISVILKHYVDGILSETLFDNEATKMLKSIL